MKVFRFLYRTLPLLACAALLALPARAELVLSATNDLASNRISAEVLFEAFSMAGESFSLRLHPARRALAAANQGDVDGALHRIAGLSERFPGLVQVPVPINELEFVAFSISPDISLGGWSELASMKVGIVRGVVHVERWTAGMDVERVTDLEQLVRLVERGRVDVGVADRLSVQQYVAGMRGIYLSPVNLDRVPLYLYLNLRQQHLVAPLTRELQQMQEHGRIREIRERFVDRVARGAVLPPLPVPVLDTRYLH